MRSWHVLALVLLLGQVLGNAGIASALDPLAAAAPVPAPDPDRLGLAERLVARIEEQLGLWRGRALRPPPLLVLRLPRRLESGASRALVPWRPWTPPGSALALRWRLQLATEPSTSAGAEPLWEGEVARRLTDPVHDARFYVDRLLAPGVSAGLSVRMLRNPSEVRAYEYENHVIGVYLQLR
jgi:hypothetical protein